MGSPVIEIVWTSDRDVGTIELQRFATAFEQDHGFGVERVGDDGSRSKSAMGADPLRQRKVDQFRDLGFGATIRIDREQVALAA
jgi:hypothetical protein